MGLMNLRKAVILIIIVNFILVGCAALKESRPIFPIKEYEKMLAGRLDADYVGNERCLEACHRHDKLAKDFAASTMGAFVKPGTGMPMVDCESCHGPGSLAIEGFTREIVRKEEVKGNKVACFFQTLIDWRTLPHQAQSLLCLKCHTANATFNLHDWNVSTHAINDVSCSNCHKIHAGPNLIVRPRETFEMCYKCHEDKKVEFSLPSHHPVPERKIFCTDCHDTHGTSSDKLLRKNTVKETCAQCHAEKEGPFVFEHDFLLFMTDSVSHKP